MKNVSHISTLLLSPRVALILTTNRCYRTVLTESQGDMAVGQSEIMERVHPRIAAQLAIALTKRSVDKHLPLPENFKRLLNDWDAFRLANFISGKTPVWNPKDILPYFL